MKITINEKEFEIDTERAIELGICKRISKIKKIKAGDVFESGMERVMIIQPICGVKKFNIVGFNGLEPFGDFSELQTRDDMIELLNEGDYTFIANINDQINELIQSAKKLQKQK